MSLQFSTLFSFESTGQGRERVTFRQADGAVSTLQRSQAELSEEHIKYINKVFTLAPAPSGALFPLKSKIQTLAAERYFINSLQLAASLQASFATMDRLKACGVIFYLQRTKRAVQLLPSCEDIPWPIIQILCKLQRLGVVHSEFSAIEQEYRSLLTQLVELRDQIPEHQENIDLLLSFMEYLQQRKKFSEQRQQLHTTIRKMKEYVDSHSSVARFSNGTRLALVAFDGFEREHEVFSAKALASTQDLETMTQLATEDDGIQRRCCDRWQASIELYNRDHQARSVEYAELYKQYKSVTERAKTTKGHVFRFFAREEHPVWPELLIPPETFQEPIRLPETQTIIEQIRAIQKQSKRAATSSPIPPGSNQEALVEQKGPSMVEEVAAAAPPVSRPRETDTQEVSAEKQHEKTESDEKGEERLPTDADQQSKPTRAGASLEPSPPPKCATQSAPQAMQPSAQQPSGKKEKRHTSKQRHVSVQAITKIAHAITQARLPAIGDGPDPSYVYDHHVWRWYDPTFDAFTQDSEYRGEYSPAAREAIKRQHTFGLALHPVLFAYGTPYEKQDARGHWLRTTYTLPGEIRFADGGKKGMFELALGADGKIFHAYFTHLSVASIIDRYAREGCFKSDAPTLPPSQVPIDQQSKHLEDDGSRITAVSPSYIDVTDRKGVLFRAYPS
jgi:hypothetical protein